MALSYVQYVGDGTTETFAVPFPYLSRSHVNVTVDLEPVSFSWDDPYTVRVSPAPGAGSVVEVRRNTERDRRLVDFVDGSVLTETDLDVSSLQVFFIVQEAIDIAGGTLELKSDGSYGAHGRRISDVGIPVNARDAVTKEYHDGTFIPQMQGLLSQTTAARDTTITARDTTIAARDAAIAARDLAQQYRDTALTHRNAAETSETNAAASASAAAGSATNAANSASQAASSKSDAETAKTAAETARNQAQTYRNEALNFRNQAEGFKNDAAASAAAAALFDPSTYYTKTQSDGRFVRKDMTTVQSIPGPLSVAQSVGVKALPGQNINIALTDENGKEVALIYAVPSTGFFALRRNNGDGSFATLKFFPDSITYNDNMLWHAGHKATAGQFRSGTANTILTSDNVWAAAGYVGLSGAVGLTLAAGTYTPNFNAGINFYNVLGGNITIGNPTNAKEGQTGLIVLQQDGTGGRTVAFGSAWKFANNTVPPMNTSAYRINVIAYQVLHSGFVIGSIIAGLVQ